MKLLIRCAAGLYPSAWRARYGAELEALAEDVDAGWREFVDICKGAVTMQIRSGGAWRFAAACGAAGLLVAGVVALRAPNQYSSTAVLRMAAGDRDERVDRLNRAERDILSRKSLSGMIQKYDLYPNERKKAPLEDIVQDMRNRHVQIRMLNFPKTDAPARAFTISFESDDPGKALDVTTDLTDRFIAAMKDTAPLELLDPANRPLYASRPNRLVMLTVGLVLGLVTGLVLVGIRRWAWRSWSSRRPT